MVVGCSWSLGRSVSFFSILCGVGCILVFRRRRTMNRRVAGLFVGCLTSRQHASVSQGRICSDKCTCFHTEAQVADQTFYLIQPQHTDTGPTSPSAEPVTSGAWQGSHWSRPKKAGGDKACLMLSGLLHATVCALTSMSVASFVRSISSSA